MTLTGGRTRLYDEMNHNATGIDHAIATQPRAGAFLSRERAKVQFWLSNYALTEREWRL